MADAGRSPMRWSPSRGGSGRQWWSPAAFVAVFAAALLAIGPFTPLANVGLGAGCAAAANELHVGVVIDYSGLTTPTVQTGCAPWLTGRTAIDVLKLAFPKANIALTKDGKVCMIDKPSGACAANPPGTWVFATSKGDGSWTPNHDPQNQPVANGSVVGWKYVAGATPTDQMPAVVPDITKICAPAASPTPSPKPTPTTSPTPAATNNQTTTPTGGSNPNSNYTPPTNPTFPPPTQAGPNQPGVPGTGDSGLGSGDPGATGGPPSLNANPVVSTYDTRGWTQWGLILVAAGFALVMVTGGLFTSNVILSRRSAKKGKHRRSGSRLAI